MGLETPTYVSDLVPTNPVSTDLRSQGDDHIRNLKIALQNTFPNASRALFLPTTTVKSADFTVLSTDINKIFLINTAAPSTSLNVTLPALTASNDGWFCHFMKTNSGATPYMVNPASGTLQSGALSGLSRTRRAIPGVPVAAFWTGSAWIIERATLSPVGAILDFSMSTAPVGFELAYGQTLTSSQLYPDYFAAAASLVVVDRRGRVGVGRDDMGGSAAGRVTSAGSGITGTSLAAAGGSQNVTLTATNIPEIGGITTSTIAPAAPTATTFARAITASTGPVTVMTDVTNALIANQSLGNFLVSSNWTHSHGVTVGTSSPTAVNNMPPSIITNNLVVVE